MSPTGRIRGNLPGALLIVLVVVFACLSHEVIRSNAIMLDEYAHLPAGISYWEMGRFYLYRENPPLVQGLAALPVWLSGAEVDYSRAGLQSRSEWDVGADFLRSNTTNNHLYFFRARSVITLFAVLCGVLIFRWGGELYGRVAAVVGAALWFLDPNVIAYSSVLTTDVGAAAFGVLATYAFWHFLRDPTSKKALLSGVALGLAQGAKFSLLALYPAWLVLAVLARRRPTSEASSPAPPRSKPFWLRVALVFGVSLVTLNALYAFDGTFSPLGSFAFKCHALTGERTRDVDFPPFGNRFAGTPVDGLPVPLPKDYLLGIDSQKWEADIGFLNLSGGELVRGGRWYSPFVTMSRKLPMGTLLLLAAAVAIWFRGFRRLTFAEVVVLVPPIVMLGMLCSQVGLNWIFRYSLIAIPFLLIAVGKFVRVTWDYRWARFLILACLVFNSVGLFRVHPSYFSYGNELIGGPSGAQRVFLGGNFDWGQDLLRLKQWCEKRPHVQPIAVSYYGVIDPASIGLRTRGLPVGFSRPDDRDENPIQSAPDEPFYWAISSNALHGLPVPITLEDGSIFPGVVDSPNLKPENAIARISDTIYVFRVHPTAAGPSRSVLDAGSLIGCIQEIHNQNMYTSP